MQGLAGNDATHTLAACSIESELKRATEMKSELELELELESESESQSQSQSKCCVVISVTNERIKNTLLQRGRRSCDDKREKL